MTVTIGASYYSRTRVHADDEMQPLGGTCWGVDDICTEETEAVEHVRLVEVWRGVVRYHLVPASDLISGASGGLINTRTIKSLLLALAQDEERKKNPLLHLNAKTVLAGVLARHTPARRAR